MHWDEQMEIALFRGIIKYRPVGINKHFHMISLHDYLSKNATTPISVDQIWSKLENLYDLEALDAMEESEDDEFDSKRARSNSNLQDKVDSKTQRYRRRKRMARLKAFSLPYSEFESLIDERRVASTNTSIRLSGSPIFGSRPASPTMGADGLVREEDKIQDDDDQNEKVAIDNTTDENEPIVSKPTRQKADRESSSATAAARSSKATPRISSTKRGVPIKGRNVIPSPRTPVTTTYTDRKASRRSTSAYNTPEISPTIRSTRKSVRAQKK